MLNFATNYNTQFQNDFLNFIEQIPMFENKHYNKNVFNIQYFFLTPQYNYLDIIPEDRQGLFAVSLYWTILVDQIFYTYYKYAYQTFQLKTMYPKFIGNCTAPSIISSECGYHQNPNKILIAINDKKDKGNKFDFDREIFKNGERNQKRKYIEYVSILDQSKAVMKDEINHYFENYQPEINWSEFWMKCEQEL